MSPNYSPGVFYPSEQAVLQNAADGIHVMPCDVGGNVILSAALGSHHHPQPQRIIGIDNTNYVINAREKGDDAVNYLPQQPGIISRTHSSSDAPGSSPNMRRGTSGADWQTGMTTIKRIAQNKAHSNERLNEKQMQQMGTFITTGSQIDALRRKSEPWFSPPCNNKNCSDHKCGPCNAMKNRRRDRPRSSKVMGEPNETRMRLNDTLKRVEHWYDSVKSSLDSSTTEYFHEDEYEREFDNIKKAGYKGNLEARAKKPPDKMELLNKMNIIKISNRSTIEGVTRRERLQSDSDIIRDRSSSQGSDQPSIRSARNSASDDYVGRTVKKQITHDLINQSFQQQYYRQQKKTGKERVRFMDANNLEDDAFLASEAQGVFEMNKREEIVDESLSEIETTPVPKFVESREIHV